MPAKVAKNKTPAKKGSPKKKAAKKSNVKKAKPKKAAPKKAAAKPKAKVGAGQEIDQDFARSRDLAQPSDGLAMARVVER